MQPADSAPLPRDRPPATGLRIFAGVAILLMAGLGFATSVLFASMAIKNGVDVSSSNAVRYGFASILFLIYQVAARKSFHMSIGERAASLALGIPVFMMGIGYLGATKYIPVSLAVLIFYTGPFFVILISRVTEKEPITLLRVIALGIAFVGLVLALGVQSAQAAPMAGILFAFMAALGMAVFITFSSLTIRTADPQMVNLHALVAGTLMFAAYLFISDGDIGRISSTNLACLLGSGLAIGGAYAAFYIGLRIIGPVRASMLLNTEPVFTIALSAVLLGERLTQRQLLGAVLVILGVVLINIRDLRKHRPI